MASPGYYRKLQRYGYLFIFPTIALFAIFLIYSMLNSFQLSFFQWSLLDEKVFVGLRNFVRLVRDGRFWNSYRTTSISADRWPSISFSSFWSRWR